MVPLKNPALRRAKPRLPRRNQGAGRGHPQCRPCSCQPLRSSAGAAPGETTTSGYNEFSGPKYGTLPSGYVKIAIENGH